MANTKLPWIVKVVLACLAAGLYCYLLYSISSSLWRILLLVMGVIFVWLAPRNPEFWRRRLIVYLASCVALSVASPVLQYSLPKELEAQYGTFVFALPEVHPVTLLCVTVLIIAFAFFDHREKILLSDGSTATAQTPLQTSLPSENTWETDGPDPPPASSGVRPQTLLNRARVWWPVALAFISSAVAFTLHYGQPITELPSKRVTSLQNLGAVITTGEGRCEIAFKDSSISNVDDIARLLQIDNQAFEITLSLSNCHEVADLSPLLFVNLHELHVVKCSKLMMLWSRATDKAGTYPLEVSLTQVKIHNCDSFASARGLERFGKLNFLSIRRCKALVHLGIETIVGKSPLDSLIRLDLAGSAVVSLDQWPKFEQLETIWLSDCENLQSLSGLNQLAALKKLDVSGCTALSTLDSLLDSELHELGLRKMSAGLDVSALKKTQIREVFVDSSTSERVKNLGIGPTPHVRESIPPW